MFKRLTPVGRPTMVRNILQVHSEATRDELLKGARWYGDAHAAAALIARETGVQVRTVAAVISALSPSNMWHRNVLDAAEYCKAWRDGLDRPSASTYGAQQRKAWNILHAERGSDLLSFFAARSYKTRAFFLSIAEPETTHGTVVVDGHTYNIACGVYQPLDRVPDLSKKGRYFPVAEAFVAAGIIADVTPQALQATCWLAWRRIYRYHQDDFHPIVTTKRYDA